MSIEKCLTCQRPRAESVGTVRGLCMVCYSTAKKKVAAGETTWEEIISLGLALLPSNDAFTQAFNKAKEGK